MVRLVLLACLTLTLDAQVKINEVLFYTDPTSQDTFRTQQWVELSNAGTDPVDLTGWSVTASDGLSGARARALPSVLFPAGAYLVVHFASGTNSLDFTGNSGDYYTGDSTDTPYWSVNGDEAALYSTSSIVDFINWTSSGASYTAGQAHLDAVAAGRQGRHGSLVPRRPGRIRDRRAAVRRRRFLRAAADDLPGLAGRPADGPPDGSGDDPVHLGHHGISERRSAASSRSRQQRGRHVRPHGSP